MPGRRSLLESIVSLGLVQGAEYLIPLAAIPYLLRTIGPEGYGHIAFVQAFSMYFLVCVDFGFPLTATRLASIHRQDSKALSALFWEVQWAKLFLFLVAGSALCGLVASVDYLREIWPLMLLGLLPVLGSLLYPLWLFQGLERMREAALIMILVRGALLVGLFSYVKNGEDLVLAAALQMGAMPVAGLISWIVIIRSRHIRWLWPGFRACRKRLAESRYAFFVSTASTLYRSTNAVVLGFLLGPVAVAHYSVAEKLVKVVQELARPLNQATYPRITALAAQAREAAMPMLRHLLLAIGILGSCSSLALLYLADEILILLGGNPLLAAVPVLHVMAFVPLIGGLNSVLGIQTLMAFGYDRAFSRLVAGAGIFNLAAVVPLSLRLGERGAALSYFLSELVLLLAMAAFLRTRGVRYWRRSRPVERSPRPPVRPGTALARTAESRR